MALRRAPVVVAPLTVSQLNVEAVAGINPRRFLEWLAANPSVPRTRVGKLVLVEAGALLARLSELAASDGEAAAPSLDGQPDNDADLASVDAVLRACGRRRTA
jgi:hypothetical protein